MGSATWFAGHPPYRVRPSFSTAPAVGGPVQDGFAWPIIDLTPGVTYEVEVTVTSGGVSDARTLTHTTRALPAAAGTPNKTADSAATIASQLAGLNPGDVLQIAAGTYDVNGLTLTRSGTVSAPIYIRGASRTGTILRNSGSIFSFATIANVVIENMTLIGSGVDSGNAASSVAFNGSNSNYMSTNVTIRNITATGIDKAVNFFGGAQGILVYDNTFDGNNLWQTSPVNFINSSLTWNDDGIKLTGQGNCAFNNTIKGFGDTFAYASHSGSDVVADASAVHYYRNEIRNSCDDPIEVDHGRRNLTWYDNRIHNGINFGSVDLLYGGPWLCARNILINAFRTVLHKWNGQNTGHFYYNNTCITTTYASSAGDTALWYNPPTSGPSQRSYGMRNNVHIYHGGGRFLWIDTSVHNPVDWTHNSWYTADQRIQLNFAGGGSYNTLALAQAGVADTTPIFSGTTRRLQNDNMTVSNPWTTTITLPATSLTEVTQTYLPTLAVGTAPKNSGVVIPNITDGFSGPAPDRGAIIAGRSVVAYGDRT